MAEVMETSESESGDGRSRTMKTLNIPRNAIDAARVLTGREVGTGTRDGDRDVKDGQVTKAI